MYDILCESEHTVVFDVSQKIKDDIKNHRKEINEDNLFIEDSIIIKGELLSLEDLNDSQAKVLYESISIVKEIDFIKNDYVSSSLDNIKIPRVPVGWGLDKESGIVIPLNSLTDVESCTVKIINVISSLGTNSAEYKERILASLIRIIHERNINERGN